MRNRHPATPAAVTVGTLTVAIAMWTSMAQGSFCWRAALSALGLWSLLGYLGVCLSAWLIPEGQSLEPILASVLGVFCMAITLFMGTVVLHLDLLVSFGLSLVLVGAVAYKTLHLQPLRRLELTPASVIALLITVVFTTLWSRQNLAGLALTPTTVTSMPWFDTFYHSVHINHFAQGGGAILGTDPLLGPSALLPYHYAAYMIPSLLVRLSGIPAYLGTVAVFAPLGTLLTGITAYGFGRVLRGPVAGLLAVVACLALPDATFYLLENRWLSYFFFQQIAANGAMGTALMLLAWTFCIQGNREQLRRYTLVGLGAAACVIVFKSQVFLSYSFGLLLFAAMTFPRVKLIARLALSTTAVATFALCAFKLLPAIPRAPTLLLGTTAGPANLHWSLSKIGGACQQCIAELAKDSTLFLPVGLLAFLLLVFGILVPLALLLASSPRVRNALGGGGMWFLWTALINYAIITLGLELNAGHGDPYEIIHKTFIWPYLAIAAWCGSALEAKARTWAKPARQAALFLGLPLLLLVLGYQVFEGADRLQTAFVYPGSEPATRIAISRDVFEAARYLRERSPKNAVIQLGELGGNLMFQSLAERRAYVAYPAQAADVPVAALEANHRLAAMLSAPSEQDFKTLAHQSHVDYFILFPGQQPAWAATLEPAFQRGDCRVYRL